MPAMSLFIRGIVAFLLLVGACPLFAQIRDNGPMTIVITYKSPPEKRAAFRGFMETSGAGQFEQWKRQGVFRDYQVLFSSFAGDNAGKFDMAVILHFASFGDVAKWKDVEKGWPGGLSTAGLALGYPERTTLAYPVGAGEAKVRNPAKATYVLGFYEILVDAVTYAKYAHGYVEPQLRGWVDEGAMTAYGMYLTQPGGTPDSLPWTFLLVLEYTDMASLAESEIVKDKVRAKLLKDPAWKAFSDDKGSKRKAKGFVFADAIVAPAR